MNILFVLVPVAVSQIRWAQFTRDIKRALCRRHLCLHGSEWRGCITIAVTIRRLQTIAELWLLHLSWILKFTTNTLIFSTSVVSKPSLGTHSIIIHLCFGLNMTAFALVAFICNWLVSDHWWSDLSVLFARIITLPVAGKKKETLSVFIAYFTFRHSLTISLIYKLKK